MRIFHKISHRNILLLFLKKILISQIFKIVSKGNKQVDFSSDLSIHMIEKEDFYDSKIINHFQVVWKKIICHFQVLGNDM